MLRPGLESSVEYDFASGPDSARLTLDALLTPGTDSSALAMLFRRMRQVEEGLKSLRATVVTAPDLEPPIVPEEPLTPAEPVDPEPRAE